MQPSKELYLEMGAAGMIAAQIYPGKHLEGFKLPGGLAASEFDYFHELICHQELNRIGAPGVVDGLKAGLVIGLPPVMKAATPAVRDRVT